MISPASRIPVLKERLNNPSFGAFTDLPTRTSFSSSLTLKGLASGSELSSDGNLAKISETRVIQSLLYKPIDLSLAAVCARKNVGVLVVKIIRKNWGADGLLGENLFHLLVRHDLAPHLIEQAAKVEQISWQNIQRHPFNAKDNTDQKATPLIRAVAMGRHKHAELLCQHGVSKIERDTWGRTALHYAVMRGDHSMVQLLLQGGLFRMSDERELAALDYLDHPELCKEALASYGVEYKPFDPKPIRALFEPLIEVQNRRMMLTP